MKRSALFLATITLLKFTQESRKKKQLQTSTRFRLHPPTVTGMSGSPKNLKEQIWSAVEQELTKIQSIVTLPHHQDG